MIPALFPPAHLEVVIPANLTTSAGVFDSTGKLVRTLWSAEVGHPNRNAPEDAWDGKLDDGSTAPTDDYVMKAIAHECVYTWEGAVGNTSPTSEHDTLTYHNESGAVSGMEITAAGEMYYCSGYSERHPVVHVLDVNTPNVTDWAVLPTFRNTFSTVLACCTDGTRSYWSVDDPAGDLNYVWATVCASKTIYSFPTNEGTSGNGAVMISKTTTPNSFIGGVGVQKSGNFLFVSRPNQNEIKTYHKVNGTLDQTNTTWTLPGAMAVSASGAVWLAVSTGGGVCNKILKLNVSGAGALSASGIEITGLVNARAVAVDPTEAIVLVMDSNHQVKAFNASDGSVRSAWGNSGTLGVDGGYAASPTVTNTKFMFANTIGFGSSAGAVAYEPDGSWWLSDAGNCRLLHFTSGNSPSYIETVAWAAHAYSCKLDQNDPTRLFHSYLEFAIDYNVAPDSGWTLVRNWFSTALTAATFNDMKYVTTFPNGRTYALSNFTFVELTPTGLRNTGIPIWFNPPVSMEANGDIYYVESKVEGQVCRVFKNSFVGFDGSNNPVWAAAANTLPAELVYTTEVLPTNFPPTVTTDINMDQNAALTAGGILPFYNLVSFGSPTSEYNHFGGVHAETGLVKFNTHKATPANLVSTAQETGLYPEGPIFPLGMAVGTFGGGQLRYVPGTTDIFTCYRGENWGSNQTNVWYHWDESGLMLGRFGPAAPYFAAASLQFPGFLDGTAASFNPNSFKGLLGMAGNTAWGGIGLVNGKYYIFQNDEWYHSGPSRWCVSNCESIQRFTRNFHWDSSNFPLPADPTDLLAGLPFNTVPASGAGGWVRSHSDQGPTAGAEWLAIRTSEFTADPRESPDIMMWCSILRTPSVVTLRKDVVRNGSDDWALSGKMFARPGIDDANPNNDGLIFVDILDGTGKRIIRFSVIANGGVSGSTGSVYVNDLPMFPVIDFEILKARTEALREFSFEADVSANTITVRYIGEEIVASGVHEVGADRFDPTSVELRFTGGSTNGANPVVDFTRLRFTEV